MADSHIGVGIIGTGTIAQAHLTGLAGSQRGRPTAAFDVLSRLLSVDLVRRPDGSVTHGGEVQIVDRIVLGIVSDPDGVLFQGNGGNQCVGG